MKKSAFDYYKQELLKIKESGLWKDENVMLGRQGSRIDTEYQKGLINMCANNYLGLSSHPEIIDSAIESYKIWGYGLSSVRFICGTQEIHKKLERKISEFTHMEDTILYSSCFDANGGLFETLLGEEDAIISDELNHASIIDGIRLCKAKRFRYKNNDMNDLEEKLKEAQNSRIRLIATDGVFSMDGIIANLKEICDLAEKYDALVMVDDSHGMGAIGKTGRGTLEYCDVFGRVDIVTGTLGKAFGGASGGFTAGKKEIIDMLRQRSRPYLFSNSLAPAIVSVSLKVFEMLENSNELIERLHNNTLYYRDLLKEKGFSINEGEHPIVPIIIGDAVLAQKAADFVFKNGVFVVSFSYPVVPKGKARIRTQVSAAHTKEELKLVVEVMSKAKSEIGF